MTNEHQEGTKADSGKAPIYRGVIALFPRAIQGLATVSAFGANQYSWTNWLTVPDGIDRYSDAMVRHLIAEAKGQALDDGSGLPHSWHALWNAAAVAELKAKEFESVETYLQSLRQTN